MSAQATVSDWPLDQTVCSWGIALATKHSYRMSQIRSKNTKVEVALRRRLWQEGLRYRIHGSLPGHPDIVFSARRVVVFVDGDFWHGYDWVNLEPKLTNPFWRDKIIRNMERDKEVGQVLKESGWTVLRFWEHRVNEDLEGCVAQILGALNRKQVGNVKKSLHRKHAEV